MALSDWTILRRSIFSRLFSTTTTVITVAVAVALMLVLLTLRDSGRKAFDRGSGDMHLIISADASPLVSVLNGIFYANAPQRSLNYARYLELKSRLPAAYLIPTQQGDSYMGLPVLATKPEFFTQFKPNPGEAWSFSQGRAFEREFEVVVGAAAARQTKLKIGDELFLTHGTAQSRQLGDPNAMQPHIHKEFTYRIVGILAPTGGSHDRALFTDLNSTWIIHAHDKRKRDNPQLATTTLADVTDADRLITGMYLRLATRPGSDTPANLPQIFDMLRRDPTITVASPRDQIDKLFGIVSNIDVLFLAMAVVVMISSGIGIMLALYNSMDQRRRQIAILRVLGCSRGRVFGLVITESAIIGTIGALAGVALAFLGGLAAASILKQQLGLHIDPRLSLRLILVLILATIALASLAGLFPALIAYRTSVSKHLKPIS